MKDRVVDFDPLRRFVGVLLQQGRVQVDADTILRSLDRALGLDLFAPANTKARPQPRTAPDWSDTPSHDPGITLLELLAYTADQLSAYADQVAAEERLQTRRRAAVVTAAGIVVLTWWCRRSRA
jgi:hypothetical protein